MGKREREKGSGGGGRGKEKKEHRDMVVKHENSSNDLYLKSLDKNGEIKTPSSNKSHLLRSVREPTKP